MCKKWSYNNAYIYYYYYCCGREAAERGDASAARLRSQAFKGPSACCTSKSNNPATTPPRNVAGSFKMFFSMGFESREEVLVPEGVVIVGRDGSLAPFSGLVADGG